jgi:trans-2,3-dihydro-3-hydroxyanthranilate isomerase
MPRPYRFVHVDVFTSQPFGGNQLAVFTDARGMSADEMQRLAREMNFAESAFVLPAETPEAIRRVRIFTPVNEMPFAGHPTVGTAFVLASEGVIPLAGAETLARLQLNIGATTVRISARRDQPDFVWMEQRPAEFGEPWENALEAARALGVEADDLASDAPLQIVSTGVPYLIVPLRSLDAIRRVRPDFAALRRLLPDDRYELSVYVFTRETEDPAHTAHARMFSLHSLDLPEDAATGSAAGPLGAYLARRRLAPPGRIVIEQGYEMGRPSLIHVEVSGDQIAVGGQAVKMGEGVMTLP